MGVTCPVLRPWISPLPPGPRKVAETVGIREGGSMSSVAADIYQAQRNFCSESAEVTRTFPLMAIRGWERVLCEIWRAAQ